MKSLRLGWHYIVATILIVLIAFLPYVIEFKDIVMNKFTEIKESKEINIISSTSNMFMDSYLMDFAKENKIDLNIEYYGDLEIVDILNNDSDYYDAVWISNSIWLYMLDNSSLVTDSKSIAINPVVMAVEKKKALELGLDKEIKNEDILELIKEGKLNYVMSSVTKTNTGATAYLGFLNSLAGSPEVLKSEMLQDEELIQNMKSFFSGVQRVSGDETYLEEMFLNGNYDAMINYESSLIGINKKLISMNKDPLYLLYPIDGVAINDMPFGYINHNNDSKKNNFEMLQKYLRSIEAATILEENGYRTWYGGINTNAHQASFNKDWGIDTNKYLIPLKYPSKKVIKEALDIYVEQMRKPAHVVFCLDVSGSMYNYGLDELKDAMLYILDREEASKDRLQFSTYDKITIITFNGGIQNITNTYTGDNTQDLINYINKLNANGSTNIYDPSMKALNILNNTSSDYTKTVILMTDGESNGGSFNSLKSYYETNKLDIPIYSIMFGSSSISQLREIAKLTNGKVFDGKEGLKEAFIEVRSYN